MDFRSRCSSQTELQQSFPSFIPSKHMDDLQIIFGPLQKKKWKSWKRISERIWEVLTNQVTLKIGSSSRLTKIVMLSSLVPRRGPNPPSVWCLCSLYLFFKPLNEQIYQQERQVLRIEDTYNVLNRLEGRLDSRVSSVYVLDQPFMKGIAAQPEWKETSSLSWFRRKINF